MKVCSYGLAGIATAAIAVLAASTPTLPADLAVAPEAIPEGESFWYASLHGGAKFGEDWHDEDANDLHADLGWRVGSALGYSLTSIFSLEGELSYMQQDTEFEIQLLPGCCDNPDLSIVTGMFNLVAGVNMNHIVRPYAGAGIGLAHVFFDSELDEGDTVFAVQGLAGADVMVTERFAIGARYRVVHLSDVELMDTAGDKHEFDPDLMQSVEAVFTVGF